MTIDTASLHEELQRLNTIVRLLADRNRELESELDRYRSAATAGNEGGRAPDRFAPTLNVGGSKHEWPTPAVNGDGSTAPRRTPTVDGGGSDHMCRTPEENAGGSDQARLTPGANPGGRAHAEGTPMLAPARMELRPVAPVPVRALAPLPSEEALIGLLKRTGMGNVPNDGVRRAARLLLWVARDTGPITYAAIRERLHLSEDGVCKLIMSLRKRGLLERSGWQRLRVSDRTLQLMEDASGNT